MRGYDNDKRIKFIIVTEMMMVMIKSRTSIGTTDIEVMMIIAIPKTIIEIQ